jgi:hypothetical protein
MPDVEFDLLSNSRLKLHATLNEARLQGLIRRVLLVEHACVGEAHVILLYLAVI